MFESKEKESADRNNAQDLKNMSLDFKLMFVYHIAMMFLFAVTPIKNPVQQAYLALLLMLVLVSVSCIHKIKSNWSWPGLTLTSLPAFMFNLVFTYAFLVFSSYVMQQGDAFPQPDIENIEVLLTESWQVVLQAASKPHLTPWYLGGLGIAFMNAMVSLRLSTLKQTEFDAQCPKRMC
jgi:membrane-associated HD superfamily phosphohydrolase